MENNQPNSTANDALKMAIIDYKKPKTSDDIDLIGEVRNILISNNLGSNIKSYDDNRFIIDAADKTSEVQRYFLNRYWSNQLMMADESSIDQRYSLIPDGSIADWLNLFKVSIVPFLIKNNLPKPI